uniref:Hydrogenase maturation nickel metallochaperone HypA n=1 Tax=Solibacter usitatus (strain Ellin6076) TaxID=234267 RepID=Q01R76_SOLUE
MHELGIAHSVLKAAHREAERFPGSKATGVGVRIGPMAGIDPASLSFCFEAVAEGLVLTIETGTGDQLDISFVELDEPDCEVNK